MAFKLKIFVYVQGKKVLKPLTSKLTKATAQAGCPSLKAICSKIKNVLTNIKIYVKEVIMP